ncbi:MAG: hypothetical protein F4X98_03415 [Gammaproteobacteria bacterium]|nr:hypothetical protein [Gammaproteobacteria bacterium]
MARRSREAYFQALGVDVWVRRGSRQKAAPSVVVSTDDTQARTRPAAGDDHRPRPHADSEREPSRPKNPPAPPDPNVGQAFRVRCFHYGRVFAVVAEDAWPQRRFLVDVAWALNGFKTAERRDLVFDWPQPGATAEGGDRAFAAFFGHQTRTRDEIRVIVAGARVAELLGHPVPDAPGYLGDLLYVPPSAPNAATKRALWQLIAHGAPAD